MTRVLVVDDDPVQLRLTAETARRAGFTPMTAAGGAQALEALRSDPAIAAVILDLVMPELDGMAVLEAMRREGIGVPVIVETVSASLESVVSAMRQGAIDFFVKPVSQERLLVSLSNAVRLRQLESVVRADQRRQAGTAGLADLITRSPAMDRVKSLIAKAAKSAIPVLIEGEPGVGKELAARIIHGIGDRAGKPFIIVDCATHAPNLIDATLFGQVRGALPGAMAQEGKFAEAHGGTLLLEEVGELPPETQAKLLRVLQLGEIEPLGASRPERVNVRVVTTTSTRLLNLARSGAFREDLYYRLNVLPIYMPPLRDRPEDIALLAAAFIAALSAEAGKRIAGLTDTALEMLRRYSWPGNVGQLENLVYRATLLAETAWLEPADFPQVVGQLEGRTEAIRIGADRNNPSAPVHIDDAMVAARSHQTREVLPDRFLDESGAVSPLSTIERELIAFALRQSGGRMSKAARALGIGRSTLYRKLREFGLEETAERDAA
jgi:DNA-binding NtrC family response regulator